MSLFSLVPSLFWLGPVSGALALLLAFSLYRWVKGQEEGNEKMREIAALVSLGAMAYLKQQYRVMLWFFLVVSLIFLGVSLWGGQQSLWVPLIFLSGGFCSGLAGFWGMKTAVMASSRTTAAAQYSLNRGLKLAFRSGGIIGLVVVGLGLLAISLWYIILIWSYPEQDSLNLSSIMTIALSFGMGASTQALFARVGGGIFTKAADVGGDLVGKVEAGIPEDDPRNPAVIADNVGDNVGDVAGMGADLFESYAGSILAAATLGSLAFAELGVQVRAALAPVIVAGLGIVLSALGIFLVRSREQANQRELLRALDRGILFSTAATAFGVYILLYGLGLANWVNIASSVLIGLLVGIVIGKFTEYVTSDEFRPTRLLAKSAASDSATLIINGIGGSMMSTSVPVLAVSLGIILAFGVGSGWQFEEQGVVQGLYGISMAAVGMLSTLGITLASDAYGPIADNAGGNAEMSGLPAEVRERTDALDSLGNTTAAIGKGFAIGSAAMTALALLASYLQAVRGVLVGRGEESILLDSGAEIPLIETSFSDLLEYFSVSIMNPLTLVGFFIGTAISFFFCGLTMNAVGRVAGLIVEEVRRQFREIPGLMEGRNKPDYANCIMIATRGAQREMISPALLAILMPVLVGYLLGVGAVLGLLVGALTTCFSLGVFMANAGGSWDNAKKYIESGEFGGKGSAAHQAAVLGDTIGDPFKDTSGPSMNILIKLMSMVSISTAAVSVSSLLG